jgi:hypothetical protein
MANYDLQVLLHKTSGIPADDVINTLHFSVNAPDTIEGTCDEVAGVYAARQALFSNDLSGMTIKAYEEGTNPAGPVVSKNYPFAPGSATASPAEICLCLSYATVDNPDASTPRRRGRLYIGPFSGGVVSNARPQPTIRTEMVGLGQALASVGTASNTTWVMYSQRDNAYAKIEVVWCDDAWDTQRRRGVEPSARTTADVQ